MGLLECPGPQAELGEVPVPPVVDGRVLRPDFQQDVDGLVGHRRGLVEAQAELDELTRADAFADAEIEAALGQVVQHGSLGGQPERMMKGQHVDVVAEAHALGALQAGRDHEIGAGQDRVVGEMVLGKPALAKAEALGQRDLVEHLGVRLIVRRPPALAVVEEPEIHVREYTVRTRRARAPRPGMLQSAAVETRRR
jgi:hypothetical protein